MRRKENAVRAPSVGRHAGELVVSFPLRKRAREHRYHRGNLAHVFMHPRKRRSWNAVARSAASARQDDSCCGASAGEKTGAPRWQRYERGLRAIFAAAGLHADFRSGGRGSAESCKMRADPAEYNSCRPEICGLFFPCWPANRLNGCHCRRD